MVTISKLNAVKIASIPEILDRKLFIESVLGSQLMMYHHFGAPETILISDNQNQFKNVESAFPGMKLIQSEINLKIQKKMKYLIVLTTQENTDAIDNMYKLFADCNLGLFVSFVKTSEDYVANVRMKVADEISNKEVGMTKGTGTRMGDYSETETKHTELFHESDEKKALLGLLDSLDRAMIANGTAYKVMLVIDA
ncbi:MAG: hypothetical protein ABSD68_02905, partial [Candidatus Micrarchaeales archaeon]